MAVHALDPRLVSVTAPTRKNSVDLGAPAPASALASQGYTQGGSRSSFVSQHQLVPAAPAIGKLPLSSTDANSSGSNSAALAAPASTRPNRLGLSLATSKFGATRPEASGAGAPTGVSRIGAFGSKPATGTGTGTGTAGGSGSLLGGTFPTTATPATSPKSLAFASAASPISGSLNAASSALNGGEQPSYLSSVQGKPTDLAWSAQNKIDHQQTQLRALQDLSAELRGEVVALRQEVKGLRSQSGAKPLPIEASNERDFEFDSLTNLSAEVHQSHASLLREQATALRNQVAAVSDEMAALREACSSAILNVQARMEDVEQGCISRLAAVEGELLNCCHRDELNDIRQEVWKAKDVLVQDVQELQGEALRRERLNLERFEELISKESEERIRHYDTVCQHVEEFRHALQGMERVLRTELNIVYRWRQQCVESAGGEDIGSSAEDARGALALGGSIVRCCTDPSAFGVAASGGSGGGSGALPAQLLPASDVPASNHWGGAGFPSMPPPLWGSAEVDERSRGLASAQRPSEPYQVHQRAHDVRSR